MKKSAGHVFRYKYLAVGMAQALEKRRAALDLYESAEKSQNREMMADAAEALLRSERALGKVLREAQDRKDQWIEAARRNFRPSRRDVCFICQRFEAVTEAHHVVRLADQYDRGFEDPDHEHVWLCPTHHALLHLLLAERDDEAAHGRIAASVIMELNDEEYHKVLKLLGLSGKGK